MITKINVINPIRPLTTYKLNKQNYAGIKIEKVNINLDKLLKNIENINSKDLEKAIETFITKHDNHMMMLYNNLQTVSIVTDLPENLKKRGTVGFYELYYDNNNIYFSSFLVAYHELLHLATSFYDEDLNTLYSGFSISNFDNKLNLGTGINEGYIELMMLRDLNNNKTITGYDSKSKIYDFSSYLFSISIARQLEILIGRKKMEAMAFNNGFIRLKEWLMKYKSEKEVILFFKNCDAASINVNNKNMYFDYKTNKAQNFLLDICLDFFPEKYEKLMYEVHNYKNRRLNFSSPRIRDEIKELKSK